MIRILFAIFVLLSIKNCLGQNLVPNASFEDTIDCPNTVNQIVNCKGWSSYCGTPDYFNSCNLSSVGVPSNYLGNQNAYNGNAYCGIYIFSKDYAEFREMMGRQLSNKLQKGAKYYVSMNVSLTDRSSFASNGIGVSFSTISLANDSNIFVNKNRPFVYSKSILKDYNVGLPNIWPFKNKFQQAIIIGQL